MRGVDAGKGDALRKSLISIAGRPDLDVVVCEFTADASKVAEDIRRASVVLMPSRAEGFGLVGLEAIALGIPVLVSARSGLAELLREHVPQLAASIVVNVTIDLDTDGSTWSSRLHEVLGDKPAAFERARRLREALAGVLDWDSAAKKLLLTVRGAKKRDRGAGSWSGRVASPRAVTCWSFQELP